MAEMISCLITVPFQKMYVYYRVLHINIIHINAYSCSYLCTITCTIHIDSLYNHNMLMLFVLQKILNPPAPPRAGRWWIKHRREAPLWPWLQLLGCMAQVVPWCTRNSNFTVFWLVIYHDISIIHVY